MLGPHVHIHTYVCVCVFAILCMRVCYKELLSGSALVVVDFGLCVTLVANVRLATSKGFRPSWATVC